MLSTYINISIRDMNVTIKYLSRQQATEMRFLRGRENITRINYEDLRDSVKAELFKRDNLKETFAVVWAHYKDGENHKA